MILSIAAAYFIAYYLPSQGIELLTFGQVSTITACQTGGGTCRDECLPTEQQSGFCRSRVGRLGEDIDIMVCCVRRTTSTTTTTTTRPPPFTFSTFNCNSATKVCSMSYTNSAGQSVIITLYLIYGQEVKQVSFGSVSIGSGTFIAPPFSCGTLSDGKYRVMFQVFLSSDSSYSNPILSPTQSQDIQCP